MSNSSGQNDPSTDEILSSIRRIISEDSGQSDAAAASDEDILELTDEVVQSGAVEAGRPEPVLAAVEPAAEATKDDGDRREPVLGMGIPASEEAPEPAPLSTEPVEPSVAETMTEEPAPAAVEEPETETASVLAEVDEIMAARPGGAPSMFGSGQKQGEETMAASDETSAPAAEQPAAGDIVSETATSATTAALGELTRAMDEKAGQLRVGEGDTTVSDLVKEMIRPMLREWLDENLPVIVERIVRREIQKLVDRAQDDD